MIQMLSFKTLFQNDLPRLFHHEKTENNQEFMMIFYTKIETELNAFLEK
jgi:hypothetical protein